MPAVRLSPLFNDQAITLSGAPASGYKVYSYAAGSSTPLATYTDSTGTAAQTNPIVLTANGFPTNGQIWLQSGLAYKLVFTDASGSVIKTEDNVSGINDVGSSVSQWQGSGVTPTYVSATSFTLPGDQTGEFHVGRRVQFTVTAGSVYGRIATSAYTTLTTVTVLLDSGALDAGLSAVNLSILRADKTALPKRDYVVDDLNASSLNGGALAGVRNRLINGNFAINQRAVSGTVTLAAGAYGHDRWKAGAGGCTYTFAASGADTVITITAGSLMQVVEDRNVEGGQYTLNNGGGSAQMRAAINGAATSGAYASGPITTASATANQAVTVEFSTGTVGKVQLEPGTTATPFERRFYQGELMLCQRYAEPINLIMQTAGNTSYGYWKVTKRATPTLTFTGGISTGGVGPIGLDAVAQTAYSSSPGTATYLGTCEL